MVLFFEHADEHELFWNNSKHILGLAFLWSEESLEDLFNSSDRASDISRGRRAAKFR